MYCIIKVTDINCIILDDAKPSAKPVPSVVAGGNFMKSFVYKYSFSNCKAIYNFR